MKKILFVAGVSIIGLSAAFAQEVQQAPAKTAKPSAESRLRQSRASAQPTQDISPEANAQRRTDRLEQQLGLSGEQKTKVYELFVKVSKENNGRLVQNESTDTELKKIFNQEQNAKYEAMKAERQQMMQQRTSTRSAELQSPKAIK
ncbi:MAG: hypothetical protein EOP49_09720 [Sphingobacteriales bacterium]|nr:MAG: hypothetical protein EOP49_09720 [Sphingobacteriales bacterium]